MKFIAYILGLCLSTSCGRGYELKELYSQKIENSDKIIVEYRAWSNLNDGVKFGTTVLEGNESVSIINAEQMPFNFLIDCPTKDTLFVIELRKGGTRIPKYTSTQISTFKGLTVKTDNYNYENGTSINLTFKFSNFRETKDSLIIIGPEKSHFNKLTNKNQISFLKGNIKLVESDSLKGVVKKIEIRAFIFRNFRKTSIDNITITGNDSLQINRLVYFTFEPTRQINTSEFSDFGIYKKREIKDVKTVQ